jgi:transcriptional regulator with XRE-family HTH domain
VTAKTFADLYREAEKHDDYWVAGLIHDFTEALARRMEEQGVSRAELARRLGTSQAFVTKVLRGNVHLTLATLVKLARAVGGEARLDLGKPANRRADKATKAPAPRPLHRRPLDSKRRHPPMAPSRREALAQARAEAEAWRKRANTLRGFLRLERVGARGSAAAVFYLQYRHVLPTTPPGTRWRRLTGSPPVPDWPALDFRRSRRLVGLRVSEAEKHALLDALDAKACKADADYRALLRAVQSAGGASKKVHAPKVFAAIARALRLDPNLTPRLFFDSISEDDPGDLYKSRDEKGREVLRQGIDSRAITFATVRRYFGKARKR